MGCLDRELRQQYWRSRPVYPLSGSKPAPRNKEAAEEELEVIRGQLTEIRQRIQELRQAIDDLQNSSTGWAVWRE